MHRTTIAPTTRDFIFMELQEYPAEIAALAHKVNELTHELYDAEMARAQIEARIDFEAAFNPELKNDQQRRADRAFKLLQDDEYQAISVRCVSLGQKRSAAIVERDQRQDEFRVAKLRMEREIAQIQSGGSFVSIQSPGPINLSGDLKPVVAASKRKAKGVA
jgi:hypothetical protein